MTMCHDAFSDTFTGDLSTDRRHPITKSQLLLLVTVSMARLLRVNKVLQQFRPETIFRFRPVQFRDLSALEVF